jgi:ornithine carbamoyltransferase
VIRHLLEVDDLSPDELTAVLDLATEPEPAKVLAGKGVALLFEKPSLRTRHSTEMAVVQLGGHPVSVRSEEISLGLRETVEDVARTLAGYHAAIGARVFEHATLERMAASGGVPIVNLLSDDSHPLQAIADLLTIRQEFDRLEGLTVAWVGDFSNVARSLGLAAVATGMRMRFACPPGYAPTEADMDRMRVASGADVEVTSYADEAVKGADVVSTDAWYAMGQEAEAEERRRAFEGFGVDAALLERAGARAILLHCLPAHRGEEVTAEALEGPRSRVFVQAANRMHAARGTLAFLITESAA